MQSPECSATKSAFDCGQFHVVLKLNSLDIQENIVNIHVPATQLRK